MDPEREDYEDHDAPASAIDSPADLVWLSATTAGMAALCISILLALCLVAMVPMRLLLR